MRNKLHKSNFQCRMSNYTAPFLVASLQLSASLWVILDLLLKCHLSIKLTAQGHIIPLYFLLEMSEPQQSLCDFWYPLCTLLV